LPTSLAGAMPNFSLQFIWYSCAYALHSPQSGRTNPSGSSMPESYQVLLHSYLCEIQECENQCTVYGYTSALLFSSWVSWGFFPLCSFFSLRYKLLPADKINFQVFQGLIRYLYSLGDLCLLLYHVITLREVHTCVLHWTPCRTTSAHYLEIDLYTKIGAFQAKTTLMWRKPKVYSRSWLWVIFFFPLMVLGFELRALWFLARTLPLEPFLLFRDDLVLFFLGWAQTEILSTMLLACVVGIVHMSHHT
jgi:hypothetical protein